MALLKTWNKFKNEVILSNKSFSIYGFGLVTKKIVPVLGDNIVNIFDRNPYNLKLEICYNKVLSNDTENIKKSNAILICINPFSQYKKRAQEIFDSYRELDDSITFYLLDDSFIKEYGYICLNDEILIIDNLLFIINSSYKFDYMKLAYSMIPNLTQEYLWKLYDEPIEYYYRDGKIGLPDFNNGLIIHEEGKKTSVEKEKIVTKNRVWMFGDSRVSGMLIPNEYTISNLLNKKIKDLGYRVINCGIPGREIERMQFQIETEDIEAGDIVILATGFYEYGDDYLQKLGCWVENIKRCNEICIQKKAEFLYVNLPTVLEVFPWNIYEKRIIELFNKTEFTEYNIEQMEECKRIILYLCAKLGVLSIDLVCAFRNRERYGQVFINLHHYGPLGNELIADELYKYLNAIISNKQIKINDVMRLFECRKNDFKNKLSDLENEEEQLREYIESVRQNFPKESKKGAVVLNANPFTLGHKYLVDTALNAVDYLYVFVVSEDKSFFSFQERLEMVRKALQDNGKIKVVPSGKFCISSFTFPEYFMKEDLQDEKIYMKKDLILFGSRIAKELDISVRFVGEEKTDKVTNQYNIQMKEILSQYGISVVEIPRLKLGNENRAISASLIRKKYQHGELMEIKGMLPPEVYKYLEEKLLHE